MGHGERINTRLIQISNVSPSASREQLYHMFGYFGKIEEIKVYPSETSVLFASVQSKICYIKYDEEESVDAAQHMTNTVFIDRALICVPMTEGKIPDEEIAMKTGGPALPGQRQLPPNIINQIQFVGSQQLMVTIDPSLAALGLPPYPSLPSNTDASKMEEIRRTVYVGNLPKDVQSEDLAAFFTENMGEVMYLRLAGDENLPTRFAYVEFTSQHLVPTALQNNGIEYKGNKLRIQHSTVAVVKPLAKTSDMAKKEVEDALKNAEASNPSINKSMDVDEVLRRFTTEAVLSSSAGKSPRSSSRRLSRSRSPRGHSERHRTRSRSRHDSHRKSSSRRRSRSRSGSRKRRRSRSKSRGARTSSRRHSRSPRHTHSRSHSRRSKSKDGRRTDREKSKDGKSDRKTTKYDKKIEEKSEKVPDEHKNGAEKVQSKHKAKDGEKSEHEKLKKDGRSEKNDVRESSRKYKQEDYTEKQRSHGKEYDDKVSRHKSDRKHHEKDVENGEKYRRKESSRHSKDKAHHSLKSDAKKSGLKEPEEKKRKIRQETLDAGKSGGKAEDSNKLIEENIQKYGPEMEENLHNSGVESKFGPVEQSDPLVDDSCNVKETLQDLFAAAENYVSKVDNEEAKLPGDEADVLAVPEIEALKNKDDSAHHVEPKVVDEKSMVHDKKSKKEKSSRKREKRKKKQKSSKKRKKVESGAESSESSGEDSKSDSNKSPKMER